ncbi:undecaprenyl-diphosphatase [Candidatus Roizmanbacteria bacterium CG11_big_fil_rev_8_21_14_0_20_36_8]|uniref:Undecaprenyl-diphosphatase n=1 Tax=Candidatus Roizmanbacteria bacterium CG11_big_fil_rev_8_21_14_0_20_36_8 TaxID=1974856 RepID=A0A2M6IV30_9BACT|nr:MAG: undecaprenyl-diphosphatase [Candidatus Roizmanbacteria bacterium CG11_big_fil_rev_8_21_14_0_20_36_8]
MNLLNVIILGIVEGISEFLPISSTYHLIITSWIIGVSETEFVKLFQVVIQVGAILSVVLLYWKEIISSKSLLAKLIISFIPTGIVGLFFYKVIKNVFFENLIASTLVFITVGIVFVLIEKAIKEEKITINKKLKELTIWQAIFIGLFQACAIVPGVSRSGAVLIGMLIFGYNRNDSAKYSFMLSIPTISAAALFDLVKSREVLMVDQSQYLILLIGAIIAFISAYFGVLWLIKYLQNHSLVIFGWYRIGLGILLLFGLLTSS